jgi:hypothetical protein
MFSGTEWNAGIWKQYMESHAQILIFSRIPVVGGDRDSFPSL